MNLSQKDQESVKNYTSFLNLERWLSVHPKGPLWFREYATWSEEEGLEKMSDLLEGFGAKHIVTGHNTQLSGKIQMRFGGRVFIIDTGMLIDWYEGGGASALEILGGKFTAFYLDGSKVLIDPKSSQKSADLPAPQRDHR